MADKYPALSEIDAWSERLCELAMTCSGSFRSEEARRLRDLRELMLQSPYPAALAGLTIPDAAAFEAMLKAQASTSAALSLIGDDAGYMLSRGSSGRHLASLVLPFLPDEVTAGGESPALALATAIALALQEVPMRSVESGEATDRPVLRFN